jgi:hypothetical protein
MFYNQLYKSLKIRRPVAGRPGTAAPEISVTAFVSRVNAIGRSPASPSQSSSSGSGEQRLVIDRAAHLSHGLVLDLHDVLHALAQNHVSD